MSAEAQEAEHRGQQVLQHSPGHFRRLRRTAAGAAGRVKSLLHIAGGRKHSSFPAASVILSPLEGNEDLDPESR